eukprot:TRINITY_DN6294_c0_g1_i1.p1 TRINITY_DN6294_c0_g1~~TRINITY_DN6294_c0_g1_i1.p1  ORF type:complete len:271 (-),score=55.43 TRINITY_DN6294_c0_g1_i1:231-1043(-)
MSSSNKTPSVNHTLRNLLSLSLYSGEQEEEDPKKKTYNFDQLLRQIQASEGELRRALKELNAIRVNGNWRLISPTYSCTILKLILATATENDWSLSSLNLKDLSEQLPEFSIQILEHTLRLFGNKVVTEAPENEKDLWQLNGNPVCIALAKEIFAQKGITQPYSSFFDTWRAKVPDQFSVDDDLLKGLAVIETVGKEKVIKYFPVEDLPPQPKERFSQLFSFKAKWTHTDLLPYIMELHEAGKTTEQVLVKYCRVVSKLEDGTKVYASRD